MRIFVTTRFIGIHRFPAAPEPVSYLRDPHRHLFHVRAEIEVFHDDREIEFLLCQDAINAHCNGLPADLGSTSCERLATGIMDMLRATYGERKVKVEVSEDGENGAIVES